MLGVRCFTEYLTGHAVYKSVFIMDRRRVKNDQAISAEPHFFSFYVEYIRRNRRLFTLHGCAG